MLAKVILIGWLGQWRECRNNVYINSISVKTWKGGEVQFDRYKLVVFNGGDELVKFSGFKDLAYVEGRLMRGREDVEIHADYIRILKRAIEDIKEKKEKIKKEKELEVDEDIPF